MADGAPGEGEGTQPVGMDGTPAGPAVTSGTEHGLDRSGVRGATPGHLAVPGAQGEFTSYYGRPVVKASPWEADIPAYLFLGGLAAGSSLLGAGAAATGRDELRRPARIVALGGITVSFAALVHDLGRPSRFVNMLRVAKPTSPMSMGTWILTFYGPAAGIAGGAELLAMVPDRWLPAPLRRDGVLGRLAAALATPAGLAAAVTAPAVASYTGVLLADTATPAWHEAYREMPFVFVSSAAAAAGGAAMALVPLEHSGPARRLAVMGALLEVVAERRMEHSMGMVAGALHEGTPGRLMKAAAVLGISGGVGAAVLGGRSRAGAVLSGVALMAGSVCTRFGIFHAGQESARDPRYTVVPQRERLDRDGPTRSV